jgi:hypothetical protein
MKNKRKFDICCEEKTADPNITTYKSVKIYLKSNENKDDLIRYIQDKITPSIYDTIYRITEQPI